MDNDNRNGNDYNVRFGAGGHETGGYDAGGHDVNRFGAAGHEADGNGAGGYGAAGYEATGHDGGGNSASGYGAARREAGGYDTGGYDGAEHAAAGYDAAGHGAAGYDGNEFGASENEMVAATFSGTEETLNKKKKVDYHDRIIWIILVTFVWYLLITPLPALFMEGDKSPMNLLYERLDYMTDAVKFTVEMYLITLFPFIGVILYTRITKRNRFIYRTFLPSFAANRIRVLLMGLLVGFVMNFGCIVCALLNGDIKLFLNFALDQIPFYCFALVCVFIQSSSEELWCRGFIYERINVHYPLWVAILVNGLFFMALHLANPGAGFLPMLDIAICGFSFSIAKWYTGSIWFVMGIHTAWNFTQNYLFGLPNSGLVSEVSVWGLDAANARTSLVYDVTFGVEGAIPAVLADLLLGVICLYLAAKQGRLHELTEKQVTPVKRSDLEEWKKAKEAKKAEEQWVYKQ